MPSRADDRRPTRAAEIVAWARAHRPTELLPASVRPRMRGGQLDEPRGQYRERVLRWMEDCQKARRGIR